MKDVLKANYACATDPNAAWVPTDHSACEIKGTLSHGVNDVVVDEITVGNLRELIENKTKPLLLDVREPKELMGKYGKLEGILNIPIGDLVKKLPDMKTFKDHKIVTVCRSGARAYTAAQILKQSGHSDVVVLKGGMKAWRESYKQENS
jgi:rhodanese-related sulfurtransferase